MSLRPAAPLAPGALRRLARLLALLLALAALPVAAAPVLEVFVRDGCPHCAKAEAFLPAFADERPGLRVVLRSLDRDPTARADLLRHAQRAGIWPPGVPTFVFGERVLIGFASAAETGPQLAELVDRGSPPWGSVESRTFGTLSVERLGLPLFTLALGLLDGFNPCAMWVLLFLLSLLVRLHDRRRMALVAGTFVLASGAVYYGFMAAWLNLFLVIGLSSVLRWILAGLALAIGAVNVRDFARGQERFALSIPDSAKPALYARMRGILRAERLLPSLGGVIALAVAVNFFELLCTAGLPALYTAVLTQQALSPLAHYAYLGLYILAYIADDSLMVATAVLALSSRRLTPEGGRWLKLVSGTVMLALGAVMLLRPEWLL